MVADLDGVSEDWLLGLAHFDGLDDKLGISLLPTNFLRPYSFLNAR